MFRLLRAIRDTLRGLDESIEEMEMIHKLIRESIGKTGKDLEPYITKFTDAMYVFPRIFEPSTKSKYIKELYAMWKADHGYLEGR